MLRAMILRPRVKKLSWDQLRAGTMTAAARFDEMIGGVTEETAGVRAAGEKSVREIVAEVVNDTAKIAGRLEALSGRPPAHPPETSAETLVAARVAFRHALARLDQVTAKPITAGAQAEHEFFGKLNASEWLSLVAYQIELHIRALERLMRSEEFRRAQGAKW
jgi:hypothetical protein